MSEVKECRNNMCFGKGHQEKCLLRVSFGSQYAEAAQGVRISSWKLRTDWPQPKSVAWSLVWVAGTLGLEAQTV